MATRRAFSEESSREILLSLPVKSLLRFKCVSKNWGNLINNPSFTIDHLNLSKKKKPPQHLIYDYGAADDAPTVTLVSDKGIDEQNFQRFGDNITNLLGSIDGVFFMERQIDNAILCTLWNPANREDVKNKLSILSFDFGNEVFVEMEGPPRGHEDYNWSAELMLLGDSVGILNFVDGFVHDVWTVVEAAGIPLFWLVGLRIA
ncbi:hypothetical protein MTR67_021578 [Solanum verrucosum]|uniref:F-box domain-containing protein n=1 Tax=Solanum verrucosum TaxID=315347 RepID=A0AAF0TWZ5_SOLVR|nr:hypothetical protein MTR67_021578 [Solanum verrucosum]